MPTLKQIEQHMRRVNKESPGEGFFIIDFKDDWARFRFVFRQKVRKMFTSPLVPCRKIGRLFLTTLNRGRKSPALFGKTNSTPRETDTKQSGKGR